MPSIAGINVIGFSGAFQGVGRTVVAIDRPGVDGVDHKDVGLKGKPFKVRAYNDCVSLSARAELRAAFLSLQGGIWGAVDNDGGVWPNLMVRDVVFVDSREVAAPVGGLFGGAYWLETEFTLFNVTV